MSVKPSETGRLKESSTLDETLFTCWPPAPLLRMALKVSSLCICCLSNAKTFVDGLQRYIKENGLAKDLLFIRIEEECSSIFRFSFVQIMAPLKKGMLYLNF